MCACRVTLADEVADVERVLGVGGRHALFRALVVVGSVAVCLCVFVGGHGLVCV